MIQTCCKAGKRYDQYEGIAVSQSGLSLGHARGVLQRVLPGIPSHPLMIAALLLIFTASLVLLGSRFADPVMHVAVGSPLDDRFLVRFYELEQNDTGRYRWSQPLAGIFLYGFDGRPALVDLRLTSPRPADAPAPTLALSAGDHAVGTFDLGVGWRHYHLIIPTRPAGDTPLLLQSSFFRPGSHDARDLGVALNQVMVRPIAGSGNFPPLQRGLFLLSLPLLVWLLLWRIGTPMPLALGVAVVLAGVAGWSAARPLESGYVLPTIWWPWWPFVPLLALVVAPLLYQHLRGRVPFAPWGSLALTAGAVVALRLGFPVGPGLLLVLLGTLLTITGLAQTSDAAQTLVDVPPDKRVEISILVSITLLALGLRLYHLDSLPLGIWRDEARHAELALRIWQDPTFRPVYVVGGADLPALLFYLMAPVVGTLGSYVWTARLVSVLAGALTPLALWWAARPLIGVRAALIGAALIAWSSWSLSMSRWAFPATLDHLLMLTAVGLMWRALPVGTYAMAKRPVFRSVLLMGLAALCAGLAAYTYHTGRIGPLTLAVLTAIRLGWSRSNWRRAVPALAVAAVVGALMLTPLVQFIASDWEGYNRRVARVSVLDTNNTEIHAPLSLLLRNAERYLLMWHVQGEPNGRHHAPGAPMLDPIAGTLLLVGLGLAITRWRQPAMLALLAWSGLSFVPGLFSGDAPHAMRSLGTLAPACMLAGLGLETLRQQAIRWSPRATIFWLSPLLGASLVFNVWLYFVQMPQNPAVYNEFYVTETAMARVARAAYETDDPALRQVQVFLPAKELRSDALRYLTSDVAVASFDGDRFSTPPGAQALLLMPSSTPVDIRERVVQALGDNAELVEDVPSFPQGERPLFLAYATGDQAVRLLHEVFPR